MNGDDLIAAENKWVMSIQKHTFVEEYQQLVAGRLGTYRGQFSLFLNEKELICCKGHLGQVNLPHNVKYAVLLTNQTLLHKPFDFRQT